MSDKHTTILIVGLILFFMLLILTPAVVGIEREKSFQKCLELMEKRSEVSCKRGEE